jgi:hypothetical protein
LARRPDFGRLDPDDLALHRQWSAGSAESYREIRPQRHDLREEEQESIPTDISGPPVEGRVCPSNPLTGDREIEGVADAAAAVGSRRLEQVAERLEVVRGDLGESHTVTNPAWKIGFPGPDHPRPRLDALPPGLEAEPNRGERR